MDHAEVRERLELAAVEPGGLERLTAGDTADSAAVAGHLAGCGECSREQVRVARLSAILSSTIAGLEVVEPPADLRARTLDYVRIMGRTRQVQVTGGALDGSTPAAATAEAVTAEPVTLRPAGRSGPASLRLLGRSIPGRRVGGLLAMAAVLALAVLGTGVAVHNVDSDRMTQQTAELDALSDLTTWSLRVSAHPDAKHVTLASAGGQGAGLLLFSPSTHDVVVVMTGFAQPAAGREYRCWVEAGGQRLRVGRMFFGGNLGYWVGTADAVGSLPTGAVFGVGLVDTTTGESIGAPILTGTLGA